MPCAASASRPTTCQPIRSIRPPRPPHPPAPCATCCARRHASRRTARQRLLAGIARATALWHARGQAHGAITPDRVLVAPGDQVTLAPPPRQEGAPAPWPTYLAPEQIDGRAGDARSDVYALGLVGWEMLAGQQPWEGESLYGVVVKQREQDLPRLSTLRPGLPRALVVALEGCLHKAAGDRWQSMAEFLSALEPALPAADVAAGRAADFAPPSRAPFARDTSCTGAAGGARGRRVHPRRRGRRGARHDPRAAPDRATVARAASSWVRR
jgi:hypothetical protein